jgi:hypothetical protein
VAVYSNDNASFGQNPCDAAFVSNATATDAHLMKHLLIKDSVPGRKLELPKTVITHPNPSPTYE